MTKPQFLLVIQALLADYVSAVPAWPHYLPSVLQHKVCSKADDEYFRGFSVTLLLKCKLQLLYAKKLESAEKFNLN